MRVWFRHTKFKKAAGLLFCHKELLKATGLWFLHTKLSKVSKPWFRHTKFLKVTEPLCRQAKFEKFAKLWTWYVEFKNMKNIICDKSAFFNYIKNEDFQIEEEICSGNKDILFSNRITLKVKLLNIRQQYWLG